jgi:hypothetical protein
MIQFNLCNNDIIIILVLFFVFCIFLYMTHITSKNEPFQNIEPLITSNEVKETYKKSFINLYESLLFYITKLTNLNSEYIKIIDTLKTNTTNTTHINTELDNIKTKLKDIIDYINSTSNSNKLDVEFIKLTTNFQELFTKHNELFNTSTSPTSPTSPTSNCLDFTTNIYFYINLENKLDVIEAKNIGQLKLIEINIENIKSIINKLNFNDVFNSKVKNTFVDYYELINDMYNKDSVNIFNIINKYIKKCEKASTNKDDKDDKDDEEYDNYKYKLLKNKQNLTLLNKSVETLKSEFNYFTIDEIFHKKNDDNTHFTKTKAGLKLWQSFCEKLKKLNKPNKTNLVLKKFNIDLIEKKNNYIKHLQDNIFDIQNKMTDTELHQYNINRIRTNEQATKQYNAIKKGIDNIKNKNKIKINLT